MSSAPITRVWSKNLLRQAGISDPVVLRGRNARRPFGAASASSLVRPRSRKISSLPRVPYTKLACIVPLPAVNVVLFNSQREILLTRRSPSVREPGKWCLPGGHLEGGEDWVTAMRRECAEEVGLKVKAERLLGIYSDPSLTVTKERLPEGYFGQFVVAVFMVTSFEGEVSPNEEVDRWDWFKEGAYPSPMLKSHIIRLEDAFRFRGESFVR